MRIVRVGIAPASSSQDKFTLLLGWGYTLKEVFELRCWNCVVGTALWELRCGNFVVGTTLLELRCVNDVVRTALWELRCGNYVVRTMLLELIFGLVSQRHSPKAFVQRTFVEDISASHISAYICTARGYSSVG